MSDLIQKQIDNLNQILQNLIERSIPKVGDIELNFSGINPQVKYPGTQWQQCAQGRALVGVGSNGTYSYSKRQEFGVDTVTLSVGQIPTHNHTMYHRAIYGMSASAAGGLVHWNADGSTLAPTSSTGGGQAHENRQKSIALYVWERTS